MKAEKRMLKQLEEIDRLHKLSLELMDTDKEASDKAYDDMWNIADEVVTLIVKSTFGQINEKTARYMVFHMRDRLTDLCRKFA